MSSLEEEGEAKSSLLTLLSSHPIPIKNEKAIKLKYGTAGFREEASILNHVVVRMGTVALLRSWQVQKEVGLMITASHNPHRDNGLKFVDHHGGMLSLDEWIDSAQQVVNAETSEECLSVLEKLFEQHCSSSSSSGGVVKVHIGRDTRTHSTPLAELTIQGVRALALYFSHKHNAKVDVEQVVVDHGRVTTPQLHHAVMLANATSAKLTEEEKLANQYRLPSLPQQQQDSAEYYYQIMVQSYLQLLSTASSTTTENNNNDYKVEVDCACGVGSIALQHLHQHLLSQLKSTNTSIENIPTFATVNSYEENDPQASQKLNENCGADYVQKHRIPPTLYNNSNHHDDNGQETTRWKCSFDGDADRIVFYYHDENMFRLLDGDKIATLLSAFLRREMEILGLVKAEEDGGGLRMGVVQTSYANGASTAYIRDVAKMPIVVAKTGVKHVHAAAEHAFDVGVYFEPNGHGTILFQPTFYQALHQKQKEATSSSSLSEREKVALERLKVLPALVNQAVGDAMSDLLVVLAVLFIMAREKKDGDDAGFFVAWDGLYQDLPSRQGKVRVKDRSVIQMNDNETRAIQPTALQEALDREMAALNNHHDNTNNSARCFVRPSGTEDVVRIYAEAHSQKEGDELAQRAADWVYDLCEGVGGKVCLVPK